MTKKRLTFERKKNHPREFIIKNKKNEILGQIAEDGVGKKKMWCFFPAVSPMDILWFTTSCVGEIHEFMKHLDCWGPFCKHDQIKEAK